MQERVIYAGELIDADEVPAARAAGLRIHHQVETIDWDGEELVSRDDWYAADPAWVADYRQNGGCWGYRD